MRLARANRQAVVDAYPNAEVKYTNIYDPESPIYSVHDPELGIEVIWNYDVYGGFTTVSMSIFAPYTPPPLPDTIRVADIILSADRRSVTARVLVLNQQDRPVEGAVVEATWSYPRVENQPVSGTTAGNGTVTFRIDKARRGNYYLNIDDVTLDGFEYDTINSKTLGVISKIK